MCRLINYLTSTIMFTIQANLSGTRSIDLTEAHLRTIEKYSLFQQLIDSNGVVDEDVLEKLKLNIRSLISNEEANSKDLLDLCIDVIYHKNMKAYALHKLILLYIDWLQAKDEENDIDPYLVEQSYTAPSIPFN